ncbi:casein kinase II alpha subunit [Raphidocelis subcapitata]|uniref:non-specific serine/threonine protein kinase n=1 Tax=Raphidocelis subcapitata TaxID=307507 RepID=A0A2V0NTF2_9CHLO|nr:casein kinase II alpha subunit [Raphidocelis subcapitata]|eukprot:GBF88823.1 casein kinase II alpha subunit [Raphidocelis subcapitata]
MAPPKKYPKSLRKKGALRTVARCYADVAAGQPKEYWNDACTVEWGAMEQYEVLQQLGKGKYGEVFEGIDLDAGARCVVKIMRPVKEQRLKREIKILRHVRGGPNIVTLVDLVRDPDTKTPCFVFELVEALPLRELQAVVSDLDVRSYMHQLLQALDFTHSRGIMHRDVKPANVLIDHSKRQLKLIDWGLADFYFPGKEYPVRVATRFYKGPELLLDIRDYDYSLDIWGVGCMLAAFLFKRQVFFRGEDEFDQLVRIAKVLGSEDLYRYADKYGVEVDPALVTAVGYRPRQPWRKFVTDDNRSLVTPEALDLLGKLLTYDHQARPTAAEAMAHPYFEPIRAGAAAAGGGA